MTILNKIFGKGGLWGREPHLSAPREKTEAARDAASIGNFEVTAGMRTGDFRVMYRQAGGQVAEALDKASISDARSAARELRQIVQGYAVACGVGMPEVERMTAEGEAHIATLEGLVERLRADLHRVQTNTATYREESRREVLRANERATLADRLHNRALQVNRQIARPPADVERIMAMPQRQRSGAEAAEVALWQVQSEGNVIRFVAELATMTDTEADFLDGGEVREIARLLQVPDDDGERAPTLPRLYGEEDRARAVDVLRARYDPENQRPERKIVAIKPGEMVDLVAEALGMRRAAS